jgi:hypothetical protein
VCVWADTGFQAPGDIDRIEVWRAFVEGQIDSKK